MLPIDSVGIAMAGSLPRRSREAIDQTVDSQATGSPPQGKGVGQDMLSENAGSPSDPAHAY
jgi:hypothetical protein